MIDSRRPQVRLDPYLSVHIGQDRFALKMYYSYCAGSHLADGKHESNWDKGTRMLKEELIKHKEK